MRTIDLEKKLLDPNTINNQFADENHNSRKRLSNNNIEFNLYLLPAFFIIIISESFRSDHFFIGRVMLKHTNRNF